MFINELSKRTGISIPTLRYYENLGLFKGEANEKIKTNNYKCYDEHTVEKLEMVISAKQAGFTLSEIKNLLESWYDTSHTVANKVEVVNHKINEINSKILKLKEVRKLLLACIVDIKNGEC